MPLTKTAHTEGGRHQSEHNAPRERQESIRTESQGEQLKYRSTQGRIVLVASIFGSGMAFLDATAVNVALPAIESDLHTGFAGLQWVLNGYLLALAGLVLSGGSIADRFGRRRIFLAGVIGFAAASVLCGIAPSAGVLIGSRMLQGVAAALLVPASLAMVQGAFEPADRGQAIGAWSGFSGLTTILGPLLGGWFADTISWRLVFLINPLLALVTIVIALKWVPESRHARARHLDPAGAIAVTLGLGGIVFALIEGPELGWMHAAVLGSAAGGLAALVAFIIIERHVRDPTLPLEFFRRRRFTGVTAATVPIYIALGGVMFLLTLQLQRVAQYSALGAGAALSPVTLILLVLSPPAGRFASSRGPKLPMTLGPLLAAAGIALMSRVDANGTYIGDVLPAILVFGLGLGLTVAPLTAAAMAALDDEHAGLASGVSNAVTRVAQLLAISMLPLAAGLSGIHQIGGDAFSEGFKRATWIAAALMSAGGLISFVAMRGGLRTENEA
jgi:EmrB/QacA subfamily drug resistance transporter